MPWSRPWSGRATPPAGSPRPLPGDPRLERFSAVRRPIGEGQRVADDAWLATLPDDPGEFLRLRLRDEFARRVSLGLTAPEAGDPW